MVTIEDMGFVGFKIVCEPDEEYTYLRCNSSVAGLFYVRVNKENMGNIFCYNDGVFSWSEQAFNMSEMKNKETCKITIVENKISDLLPTKEQYYAARNN